MLKEELVDRDVMDIEKVTKRRNLNGCSLLMLIS